MRRTCALVVAGLTLSAGLVGLPVPAHATDGAAPIPLGHFEDLVVDDLHGRVFLSGGGSEGIVVRDLDGGAVTTITDQPGARDMALSSDGTTLYVALASGDAISAISTSTLTESARIPTGTGTCPSTLAVASDMVWFGYGCESWKGNLGSVDPRTAPPTLRTGLLGTDVHAAPDVRSSPAVPGLLLIAGPLTGDGLQKADVSSGNLVLGQQRGDISPGDYAITQDGGHVITASGSPYHHPSYRLSDLSSDLVYGTDNPYPVAVATGPGGFVAAGFDGHPAIIVFRADGTRIRSYDYGWPGTANPGESDRLARGGLALSGDGTRLFAVTTDYLGTTVVLRVLRDPAKAPSSVALAKPPAAYVTRPFTLTGRLGSDLPIPSGQTVTITRDSVHGTVTLPARTTGTDGAFTISDTVTAQGSYGYRATWAGDAAHAGATTRVVVNVTGLPVSLSITTSAGPHAYGARPLVVAHLGTATTARTLSLYATPLGGRRVLLKTASVDARGNISAPYTMTRRTTFTVAFPGDARYRAQTYAKALVSYARLTTTVSGSYAKSGSYHLVHRTVRPTLTVTIAPNHGGNCVDFTLQRYSSGSWRTVDALSCSVVSSDSKAWATVYTTAPAGSQFRMRGVLRGGQLSANTATAWTYLKLTR